MHQVLRDRSASQLVVLFSTHRNRFANELGRRNYLTGEMWKNKPPFSLPLNTVELLMKLLGIASITLDVESGSLQVWCNLGPGYGSACLKDGETNRSLLSGFIEDGPES